MISPFGDIEAERCVIGALLQDPSVAPWALADLAPEMFTRPEYRQAWEAAAQLYHAGKAADLMTVSASVREKSGVDIAPLMIEAVRLRPARQTRARMRAWYPNTRAGGPCGMRATRP